MIRNKSVQRLEEQIAIRWSWASRLLDYEIAYEINSDDSEDPPIAGDMALFRVTRVGLHSKLINNQNQKLRIYDGDLFIGVFGNRYATDALEAEVEGVRNLSLLTSAGMVGTVKSKHATINRTTRVAFLGYLKDLDDSRINLKKIPPERPITKKGEINLVVVIGSGMNSGKTTFCRKLIKSLARNGQRVAGCKLTGSISPRDYDELLSAGAVLVTDFSDYGFPSTYKCEWGELLALFENMLADLTKVRPEIIVMEIADGVLQRETEMILNDPLFKKLTKGIIVTADSAPAALYTVGYLERLGFKIFCLSGIITSSPLYVREFRSNRDIPVISSTDSTLDLNPILDDLLKPNTPIT